jgi:N-acetylmuramoyl-L-alanine amidase
MIITLTAGHSDTDPGACANGLREADLMEDLRNRVAAHLTGFGHEVRTDGSGAYNLPLREAIKLIEGSNLAVELHVNASDNPQATGVEVVALPAEKYRAQHIANAIAACLGLRLRGEKGWIDQSATHRGKLGFVSAGGVIVECFFLSNPDDLAAYQAKTEALAYTLAHAIEFAASDLASNFHNYGYDKKALA